MGRDFLLLRIFNLAICAALFCFSVISCDSSENPDEIVFIATIPPLKMVLDEIVLGRGEAQSLLQPGVSPHTYDPKPSDVEKIEMSDGLFYVSDEFDGWVTAFGEGKATELISLVPQELLIVSGSHEHEGEAEHGTFDPHFWTDPILVKMILPGITEVLSGIDPGGSEIYTNNAREFSAKLDNLDAEVSGMLSEFADEQVICFHPSMTYYLNRYNLRLAGTIEPFPGHEPTPGDIAELIRLIESNGIKALFTEPQLPGRAVSALSSETGLPVFTLDPLGGIEGRMTYEELVLYNTRIFTDAFSR